MMPNRHHNEEMNLDVKNNEIEVFAELISMKILCKNRKKISAVQYVHVN